VGFPALPFPNGDNLPNRRAAEAICLMARPAEFLRSVEFNKFIARPQAAEKTSACPRDPIGSKEQTRCAHRSNWMESTMPGAVFVGQQKRRISR
jgi:hypothetical protein